jgi:hypothetical protein
MSMWILLAGVLSAEELLRASIAYHDPDDRFRRDAFAITLGETRPDGSERTTEVVLDPARGRFTMKRRLSDGREAVIVARGEEAEVTLDGSPVSPEDAAAHRLTSEQALRTRNYYLYLYGLPMKLRDPGTRISPEAKESTFEGREAHEIEVTYDAAVGTDTWYFYLDRKSHALIGYRFYHDRAKNDGEDITLSGEASGAGLRLPRERKWYRHQDGGYLGTDTIKSITLAPREASN